MSKHVKWESDEVLERVTSEFTAGMADLERLEWDIRDHLDILEGISA